MIIWEVSRFRSGHIADNLLRHLEKGVDELKAYTGVRGIPALRLELFDLGPQMDQERGSRHGLYVEPLQVVGLSFHQP